MAVACKESIGDFWKKINWYNRWSIQCRKRGDAMNIVNYICIGDTVRNFKDLTPEQKKEIATKLNEQALTAIGYKKTKEKTA